MNIELALNNVKKRLYIDIGYIKKEKHSVRRIFNFHPFLTTFFSFNNKIYKQAFGAPMGSPLLPIIADYTGS